MISRHLFWITGVVLSCSVLASAQESAQLLEQKVLDRELAGGQTHTYRLPLTAGQFADVLAVQGGIDVVLVLFAPDGRKLGEVDSPNGSQGPEELWFLSEMAGDYKLEVRSLEKDADAGHYKIRLKEVRALTPDDPHFVAAQRVIAEGALLGSDHKEDQAIQKYQEATRLFRLMEDKKRRATAIKDLGWSYRRLAKNEEAIKLFMEARVLFEELGLKRDVAGMYMNAGLTSTGADAIAWYEKAIATLQPSVDKNLELTSRSAIGKTYYRLGDFAQAVKNFQQALKTSRETQHQNSVAAALDNLGIAYSEQNDFVRALESHQQALALWESLGLKNQIPSTLLNIGNVYLGQGNNQQAIEYYQRALTEFEKMKAPVGMAYATSNIGAAYLNDGEYDKALEYFLKALPLKAKFMPKDPISSHNIGGVYAFKGNYSEALKYFQKAVDLQRELEDQIGAAGTVVEMANAYYSQGDYAKSLELADYATKTAQQFENSKVYWSSLTSAAQAHLALGQRKEAKQKLLTAIASIENLRTQITGGEGEGQRFFETKTKPYELLIGLFVDEGNSAEALASAERFKARALLDVLQGGRVDFVKAMTAQEQEQERRIRNELVSLNSQLSVESVGKQPDKIRLANLTSQLEKKRLESEDFRVRLFAAHPELKIQRGEMKPITPDEAVKLLPDTQSAFLEFVVTKDRALLFVLTKEGKQTQPEAALKVYPLEIKPKELAERTEQFRSQLAKGDLDFKQQAQGLYNLLLKPAEAQIKGKTHLIIVPDGVLWDLPFQALQPAQNRYLIEDAAVSYGPSLTALREMIVKKHSRETSTATLLAFGNPTVNKENSTRIKRVFMDEDLGSLPEAEKQVAALAQLYGIKQSRVYTGADAREDRAKAEAPAFRVIQFATHGILDGNSPMYSHLVLSQAAGDTNEDGLLEAWEVTNLNLNADLVVLAACETARGRVGAGEGMIGMSWAFFVAGSPTTVASQWKVESASTTRLMVEFHRNLRSRMQNPGARMSKAKALQLASLKLLKSTEYQHPFYWAGFVLVGDGN